MVPCINFRQDLLKVGRENKAVIMSTDSTPLECGVTDRTVKRDLGECQHSDEWTTARYVQVSKYKHRGWKMTGRKLTKSLGKEMKVEHSSPRSNSKVNMATVHMA